MRQLLLTAMLAAGLLSLTPSPALACSCPTFDSRGITPKTWLDRFDGAIFEGRIVKAETIQIGPEDDELKLTFRVDRHWKGVKTPEVVIWTIGGLSSCAIAYPLSRPIIIFAPWRKGRYETHMCDWPIPATSWELPGILGAGMPPPKR